MSEKAKIVEIDMAEVERQIDTHVAQVQKENMQMIYELNRRSTLKVRQLGYDQACRDYKVGKYAKS